MSEEKPAEQLKLVLTTMDGIESTKERLCRAADFRGGLISILGDSGVDVMPVDRMVLLIDFSPDQEGPEVKEDSIWRAHMRGVYVDFHVDTLSQCGPGGPFEFLGRFDGRICRMLAGKSHVISFEPPVPTEAPLRILSTAKLWPEYRG